MAVTASGRRPERIEIEPSRPAVGEVRIDVAACGVCYADLGAAGARTSSYGFPMTPGHEIAGTIAELGADVVGWSVGDRVALGWFGGSCGHCGVCRRGDVVHCPERRIPGVSYPGGWAESVTAPARALVPIPDAMSFSEAAPFGCAGVTAFNAVRSAGLRPGSRVAVFGIGGLGHLAVQFAARMGFETVAIARGSQREALARSLGAHHYLDSEVQSPGEALAALGGADLIVYTASSTAPAGTLIDGLADGGHLVLVGVDGGTVQLPVGRLVMSGLTIRGHLTGGPADVERAMNFAVMNDVRPVLETRPLTEAAEALDDLRLGRTRFRTVLEMREGSEADPR
ncbi:MAG TPA: alcohol dehydrogenase catalytic domain-containing protein [Flexivirga sp.]|uniref:alcohol dehydrogenase catalytic domain-containing protein n=1 Tax=Flexivirga sp. TaxID=1962927 RepID=UPI002CD43313|nr:alcohol dehydrogenase catalytic domain-containing protein [Flexivirga sp.]HWC24156.1 alcohol dehydrogenase catalytic domain-containing protein [Flexivirga sp.]